MTKRTALTLERLRRGFASAGVLVVAALLVAPFALPASSPSAVADAAETGVVAEPLQSLAVGTLAEADGVGDGSYGVTSYAELLREKYANGGIVGGMCGDEVCWPFPYPVEMSDGFGYRTAPCAGCSSDHRGIDLLPGAGTPIYAIADGVVSDYQEGGGYGTHLFIDHVIGGQNVASLYAHMQTGSSPLQPGEHIKRGDFVGLVGSTGAVTAPHLHLEIRLDGTAIDPLPWLQKHTGAG